MISTLSTTDYSTTFILIFPYSKNESVGIRNQSKHDMKFYFRTSYTLKSVLVQVKYGMAIQEHK